MSKITEIELFSSDLEKNNRKKRHNEAEHISKNIFGQTPRELLRKEKNKAGEFVNIPLDDKIEKDKTTLFEIEYPRLPSVKEKEKLESLLLKEIEKDDAGLIDGKAKPKILFIMKKLKETDEKVKDDLNKKIIENFSKYDTGEGKKTKKRRRRKTKRKKNKKKKTKKKN